MSSRIEYFDILRGLAILGVVAIHSSVTGLQFEQNTLNFNFTVLWRNALNFSVPLFLAISGYFLAKKNIQNYSEYFTFLKKQIPRVYTPLLFWSVVWLAFAVFIFNQPILNEIIKLVTFQSTGIYYFIAVIVQFYLLMPILYRLATYWGLIFSVLISVGMTIAIAYLRYYTDLILPIILYAGNFATWMMFFVLGLYIGKSVKINLSNGVLFFLVLLLYAISCIESYTLIAMFNMPDDAVTAVKTTSFLYSFFLIILLFNNQEWIRSKVLKKLGDMSFGIYLVHMFVMIPAALLLSRFFPSLREISPLYQLSLISIVILSCVLGIYIFNRILSERQSRLIGFK